MLPRPTTHSAALGPGVTGPSFLMSDADFEAAQRMAPHRPGAPIQPCGDGLPFCVEPSALGREHAENGGEPVKHTQYVSLPLLTVAPSLPFRSPANLIHPPMHAPLPRPAGPRSSRAPPSSP